MDLEGIESADVITAGFPCQDISHAGKGAGLAGERSGLWWQVRRTIRMVRPRIALLENVAALLTRGMGTVLGSLAQIGYDTEWHCIPAANVGLAHQRDRVWIMAHPASKRWPGVLYNFLQKREGEARKFKTIALDTSRAFDARARHQGNSEPMFFRGNARIPNTVDRLGGCGNSVAPKLTKMCGDAILEAEKSDA